MTAAHARATTSPRPGAAPASCSGRVHLIAIGGAGMSGVARLCSRAACRSAAPTPPTAPSLASLRDSGARVHVGHDAAHVGRRRHRRRLVGDPRRQRRAGRRPRRGPAGAAPLPGAGRRSWAASRRVAVAGANGKTTTTSMLVVALQQLRVPTRRSPSGGEIAQLGTNAAPRRRGRPSSSRPTRATARSSPTAPTSRSSPTCSPTTSTSTAPSRRSRRPTPPSSTSVTDGGLVVACADDDGSRRARRARRGPRGARCSPTATTRAPTCGSATVSSHGPRHPVGVRARRRRARARARGARRPQRPGRRAPPTSRPSSGLGADPDAVLAGLAGFSGTRRRFEVRGEVDGVTVVDDYAHNPAKVAAVVGTASEIVRRAGRGSLRVVFQPHLYSRTRDFAAEFAAALAPADQVVVLDVYGAREDPMRGVELGALVGDPLRALPGQRTVLVVPTVSEAVAALVDARPARRPRCSPSAPATSPPSPRCSSRPCTPAPEGSRDESRAPRAADDDHGRRVLGQPLPRAGAVQPASPVATRAARRAAAAAAVGGAGLGRRLERLARRRRRRGHRGHRPGGAGRRPRLVAGARGHPAGPGRHRGRRRPGARAGRPSPRCRCAARGRAR